ncbi:PIR Superfamily Protein [Plasmodium ovale wallikeri]|uniref:PIR Superfamily Protein n=1 Tax=Plasmodium ovale wallikeri TaxID=864142 RepID=A0A1A9AQ91_PLAOA|nr:PIR Superfamily Protein [Plasmodium ovale wallikeri]SBT58353.1 PIR Superfamily Protein [Plasmodium ovale wallikeri]
MPLTRDEEFYALASLFPKFKDYFEHGSINGNYTSKCNTIKSSHLNGELSDIIPCVSVAKHLAYINTLDAQEKSKRCIYFNYWLNEKHPNVINSTINDIQFYKRLIQGYEANVSEFKIHKCEIYHISDPIFKELKDLYNLYDMLYKIETSYSSSDSPSSSCDKANEFIRLYDSHTNKCQTNMGSKFCKELIKLRNSYNALMATRTNCKILEEMLQPQESHNQHGTVVIPVTLIIVISLIFFILYKFTPFGSSISTRTRRVKRMWNNVYKKSFQLFNKSRHKQLNLENSGYNIQYHSSLNN